MLLTAVPGSSCSLEVLDDLAHIGPDRKVIIGQSKSALTDNPVADRALPLWKTISNWIKIAKAGLVDPKRTTFELYVSRPVDGALIGAFNISRTYDDAVLALKSARNELWGDGPDFPLRRSLSPAIAPYVNEVLSTDDRVLAPIVMGLRLVCGSGSPQADIEAAIRQGPVSDAKVFTIADKMCGWVKRQVDKQLERGLPAMVQRDDFHREYVAFVRSVDRDIILRSFAKRPSQTDLLEHLPDLFVQQLDWIDLGFDEKLEAVSDYLRSSSDRVTWSRSGDVDEDSFINLNEKLCRVWRNSSRETNPAGATSSDAERGRHVHSRCMTYETTVQGMEAPAHFVPGCFHRLADEGTIGWHPAYRARLKTRYAP